MCRSDSQPATFTKGAVRAQSQHLPVESYLGTGPGGEYFRKRSLQWVNCAFTAIGANRHEQGRALIHASRMKDYNEFAFGLDHDEG
jgi:hypothetical protein